MGKLFYNESSLRLTMKMDFTIASFSMFDRVVGSCTIS